MSASDLQKIWYGGQPPSGSLRFAAALFGALAASRRACYRWGLLKQQHLPVPVVVVGNLTVGGSGKTPLTLALAQQLKLKGRRPGIISRGHGANISAPLSVTPDSLAAQVGDEPLLLAQRAGVPVWVGPDRAQVGRALLAAHPEVDVLLCDDGLQHYRLARDFEIAVFDGRIAGNGRLLPAGPLREPLSRLHAVDAVVLNGKVDAAMLSAADGKPRFAMRLLPDNFYALADPSRTCTAAELKAQLAGASEVVAIAGIGDPQRFFNTLAGLGLKFTLRPFPDHHAFTAADLALPDGAILLLTEKDAVKCAAFKSAAPTASWVLPVTADLLPDPTDLILEKLNGYAAARNSRLPGVQG
jgi:tetraacyldisaccharide 4'-kinase